MSEIDDRITALEGQIARLEAEQRDLLERLTEARVEQWHGRIEDLGLQARLAAMEADDRVGQLLEDVRTRWLELRTQLERSRSTAAEVADSLEDGVRNAIHSLGEALLDGREGVTAAQG